MEEEEEEEDITEVLSYVTATFIGLCILCTS